MTRDPIHYQLEKMGIRHICHYGEANAIGAFDLGEAATVCTECRIGRGEITLADIVLGRIDPLDRHAAHADSYRRFKEDTDLRLEGRLPKHVCTEVLQTHSYEEGDLNPPRPYERVECKLEHGSEAATADRICSFCKGSIDE